jgi:predicted nucleic acid-binding protein
VEGVLASIPVVAFDVAIARVHAKLYADLRSRNVKILEHDLQIAATALALGQPAATRDERSFPRIPGLTVQRR